MYRIWQGSLIPGILLAGFLCSAQLPAQTDCAVQGVIPESECEALVSLCQTTGGPTWDVNFGWADTNSPCSWFGVSCSAGHVEELVLRANNLVGQIPVELRDLRQLRVLDFRFNELSGAIPGEVGELGALFFLLLGDNVLSGSIPPELNDLFQLEFLYLENNQLSGTIPVELENLRGLLDLRLGGNRLSGTIPTELGNIGGNLLNLSLPDNLLQGTIPKELQDLSGLTTLDLSGNDLSGSIPGEIGQLSSLTEVNLSDNQLSGEVPDELLALTNIIAGGFTIDFNCLSSSDSAVRDLLDVVSPGWEVSQCRRILTDGFERGDLTRWTSSIGPLLK